MISNFLGTAEMVKFEWMITPWSDCTQTCGNNTGLSTNGYKLRYAHCMVRLNNSTQNVENNLCEDAGLLIPETIEKCEQENCSEWTQTDWTPCLTSKCFSWHTAIQKREVLCKYGNNSISNKCLETEKPVGRQECYNEHCKGVWRTEHWSDVS